MLIPTQRAMKALNVEFAKLQSLFADKNVDGSAALSITVTLQTMLNRELGGAAAMHEQFARLDALLAQVAALAQGDAAIVADIGALRAAVGTTKAEQAFAELDTRRFDILGRFQALMTRLVVAPAINAGDKHAIAKRIVAWESAELLKEAAVGESDATPDQAVDVTADNLTAYLRDRFAEPTMALTMFQPLAGGFGKQTILFAVAGKAISGEFVMRRDMGKTSILENDCHMCRDEFPVINAARKRGFPAPEGLWLDTEHKLLPGGDFFVMRRSVGTLPGNFFGARTAVPASLTDALADIMARLHTLPPLTELGDLTDSIREEWWNLSKGECTERYIRGWYDMYLRCTVVPSPSVVAIVGWLLDNLPDRKGKPSMLHGDIGFHNFLFHEEKLSAALDWEFAHIGDPAEELGMVRVTTGASIDWDQLMTRYLAGGGEPVDEKTLRFFQVWGYARNAAAAQLATSLFVNGADELKLNFLPYAHFPNFIRFAQALIDEA